MYEQEPEPELQRFEEKSRTKEKPRKKQQQWRREQVESQRLFTVHLDYSLAAMENKEQHTHAQYITLIDCWVWVENCAKRKTKRKRMRKKNWEASWRGTQELSIIDDVQCVETKRKTSCDVIKKLQRKKRPVQEHKPFLFVGHKQVKQSQNNIRIIAQSAIRIHTQTSVAGNFFQKNPFIL